MNVRRWYVYLVSAITLHSVTWAIIALLRNVLVRGGRQPVEATAFSIAVVLVGLPMFLVHWLWAQRLAGRDLEERSSSARRLYLFAMLTVFLAPAVNNAFQFVRGLLFLILDVSPSRAIARVAPPQSLIYELIAIVILAILWFYHWRVKRTDDADVPESEVSAVLRQLYIYLFAAVGLVASAVAAADLLRLLMEQVLETPIIGRAAMLELNASRISLLVVGLPLWLIFWGHAQGLFYGPEERERESVVRKLYLYLVVLVAILSFVTPLTIVLSDLIGRLLGVPGGSAGLSAALSVVVVSVVIWAYHAAVLRRDSTVGDEGPRQAAVARIYFYMVAAIGLAAVLTGFGGILSVLIRSIAGPGLIGDMREQLAAFTAVLLAGLPLWLLPWRRMQIAVNQPEEAGSAERRSLARRLYLYFYLFVATMTMLASVVFIVAQLVSLALGARGSRGFTQDLSQAFAFAVIALVVWLYHGSILSRESRLTKEEQAKQLVRLRVAVVDAANSNLGQTLLTRLRRDVPDVEVQLVDLNPAGRPPAGEASEQTTPATVLREVDLIIGPWTMVAPGVSHSLTEENTADAIAASSAAKILVPVREEGWMWAGVADWRTESLAGDVAKAVKQFAAGNEVSARRTSAWVIIVIVLVVLCLLTTIVPGIIGLIAGF